MAESIFGGFDPRLLVDAVQLANGTCVMPRLVNVTACELKCLMCFNGGAIPGLTRAEVYLAHSERLAA